MGKSKHASFRKDDKKYMDGYGLKDKKKTNLDKSKEKRLKRALKVHNVDELENLEDVGNFDESELEYIHERDKPDQYWKM